MRQMKESNISWVGKIPYSWNVEKNKHCFQLEKNIVGENKDKFELLSLTKKGIIKKDESSTSGKVPESFETYQSVKKDQLVMCLFDLDVSAVFSGLSNYDGMISPAYKVYNCNEIIDKNYAKYWFECCFDGRKYKAYSKSLRYVVNTEDFGSIEILLPPKDEQEKIGKYLDEKVLEIDKVIEKTHNTIEDYKRYKQSIITKAVTKGLNENAKMKYSGNEFMGNVPENWKVNKIKYISDINPKSVVNLDDIEEVTYTPMEYIKNGYYIQNKGLWKNNTSSYNTYTENDIVMAKVTPCFENGNIAIMKHLKNGVGYGSSELIVFRGKNNIENKYLFYLLQSEIFKKLCIATMTGTGGLKRVSIEFIKNYTCYIPTTEEQKRIINFLEDNCSTIDKLIENKQKIVAELEKYRQSLIYEYVTGKKEVINSKNTEMAELSLRIIEQLPNNYSMCKIKLNKIQSVILKMINYNREPDYEKYAAGPYNKEMMKEVYDTFETEKWVKLSKDGMRDIYTLDESYKEGIKKYQEHFKEYDGEITRIIKLFENKDTQESEIIATLFYCWNDFLIDGIQPTDDQIIEQFYAWSKRKKYIKATKVKKNLTYMRKNNLIPNGYGKKTIQRSNSYGRK